MKAAGVCGDVTGETRHLAQSLEQVFLHQIRLLWMGGKNFLPLATCIQQMRLFSPLRV